MDVEVKLPSLILLHWSWLGGDTGEHFPADELAGDVVCCRYKVRPQQAMRLSNPDPYVDSP